MHLCWVYWISMLKSIVEIPKDVNKHRKIAKKTIANAMCNVHVRTHKEETF